MNTRLVSMCATLALSLLLTGCEDEERLPPMPEWREVDVRQEQARVVMMVRAHGFDAAASQPIEFHVLARTAETGWGGPDSVCERAKRAGFETDGVLNPGDGYECNLGKMLTPSSPEFRSAAKQVLEIARETGSVYMDTLHLPSVRGEEPSAPIRADYIKKLYDRGG